MFPTLRIAMLALFASLWSLTGERARGTEPTKAHASGWHEYAVVLVDVQKDFWRGGEGHSPTFPTNIAQLLEQSRRLGIQVIHVHTQFDADRTKWPASMRVAFGDSIPCQVGTEGAKVVSFAERRQSERVFTKQHFDAFANPQLVNHLRERGVKHVLIAGLTTDVCVLSTAIGAGNHGFVATLVEDCCSAAPVQAHQFVIQRYQGLLFDVTRQAMLPKQLVRWNRELRQLSVGEKSPTAELSAVK